jgi:hypothetical protein
LSILIWWLSKRHPR